MKAKKKIRKFRKRLFKIVATEFQNIYKELDSIHEGIESILGSMPDNDASDSNAAPDTTTKTDTSGYAVPEIKAEKPAHWDPAYLRPESRMNLGRSWRKYRDIWSGY